MVQVILLAILVEAVLESLQPIYKDEKIAVNAVGAMILGIVATLNFKLDLFQLVGLSADISILGLILSGILISRGSNFIHELIKKVGDI